MQGDGPEFARKGLENRGNLSLKTVTQQRFELGTSRKQVGSVTTLSSFFGVRWGYKQIVFTRALQRQVGNNEYES